MLRWRVLTYAYTHCVPLVSTVNYTPAATRATVISSDASERCARAPLSSNLPSFYNVFPFAVATQPSRNVQSRCAECRKQNIIGLRRHDDADDKRREKSKAICVISTNKTSCENSIKAISTSFGNYIHTNEEGRRRHKCLPGFMQRPSVVIFTIWKRLNVAALEGKVRGAPARTENPRPLTLNCRPVSEWINWL